MSMEKKYFGLLLFAKPGKEKKLTSNIVIFSCHCHEHCKMLSCWNSKQLFNDRTQVLCGYKTEAGLTCNNNLCKEYSTA